MTILEFISQNPLLAVIILVIIGVTIVESISALRKK